MDTVVNKLKIKIILACTGEEIEIIIVDINNTINVWFNNFIKYKYNVELIESDIKIMFASKQIYSYYDQSIGNVLFKENSDVSEKSEIPEIIVSLIFSPTFIYISYIIITPERKFIQTESYQNQKYWDKIKINILISSLHSENHSKYHEQYDDRNEDDHDIDIKELYDTIIITKFIFIILLKKGYSFSYLLNVNKNKYNDKFTKNTVSISHKYLKYEFDEFDALQLSSAEFCSDKEIIKLAISTDKFSLKYASVELQNNKEIVIIAVSKHGLNLEFASDKLKNDREIVIIAVSKYGLSLEYASVELKNDREIVIIAISKNKNAIKYASIKLQFDSEIIL